MSPGKQSIIMGKMNLKIIIVNPFYGYNGSYNLILIVDMGDLISLRFREVLPQN